MLQGGKKFDKKTKKQKRFDDEYEEVVQHKKNKHHDKSTYRMLKREEKEYVENRKYQW
jgi:hypothetical protein